MSSRQKIGAVNRARGVRIRESGKDEYRKVKRGKRKRGRGEEGNVLGRVHGTVVGKRK